MNEGDELIIVDDGSDDGTYASLLERFPEYPLLIVRNYLRQGKKKAVELGCQKATHSYILQTDADCRPRSTEWIDRMRGPLRRNASIVLGTSPLEGSKGLLGAMIRYDTARTALCYTSFAKMGAPYMGVGRNLLYQRTLRTLEPMPDRYYGPMSGDDDLLVAYRGKGERTSITTHPAAQTRSRAPSSWKEHWTRSRRHAEAGLRYPLGILIPLGILRIAEFLFLLSGVLLLFTDRYGMALSGLLGVLMLRGIVTASFARSLAPTHLSLMTPFLAFISFMSRTFVELSVIVTKPTRWR